MYVVTTGALAEAAEPKACGEDEEAKVNPQACDGAIPLSQESTLGDQTVEAAALERIAFDVAAAALLLAVFLRRARLCRERREPPVRREGQVHVVVVGIVEARAHDGGFEIVMAIYARHAAEIPKRVLVEPEKRFELLIPHGFFVAMREWLNVIRKTHGRRHSPVAASSVGAPQRNRLGLRHPGTPVKNDDRPARGRERPHGHCFTDNW